MNQIRKEILVALMHHPELKFNELWQKNIASNKFAYHIKVLEQEDLIEKSNEKYRLTMQGRQEVMYFEGSTGEKTTTPLACVLVCVLKEGKFLAHKRLKQPHYGFWGGIAGKIKQNQTVFDAAAAELMEETGLEADFTLRGIMCARTFESEKQAYNHHVFIVEGANPRGEFITKTREGENKWVSLEDMKKLKMFPDTQKVLDIISQENFTYVEIDRQQQDDQFTSMNISKEIVF